MKNKNIIYVLLILITLVLTACLLFKFNEKKSNEKSENKTIQKKENKKSSFKFKTQNGENITIEADKLITATGFAGSSYYQFYLKNNNLYYLNTSNLDNKEILLVENIDNLYLVNDEVNADLNEDSKVINSNEYIKFNYINNNNNDENNNNKNNIFKFKTQNGEDIAIEADKLITATGFAGSSYYQFYLKNNNLYYLNTSNLNNKEILLAEKIDNLYLINDEVTADLNKDSKIVNLNNYIFYHNSFEGKNNYQFKTQNGEDITINADKLVTATGFAGSSYYQFYLIGNTLYFKNTSQLNNGEEIIAYNIKDIVEDKYSIYAIKQNGTIIVNNSNYIEFK